MPKATIVLDQSNPEVAMPLTFTTTGEHQHDNISLQVFPDSGNPEGFGPTYGDRQPVGSTFILPPGRWEGPASVMVNLERGKGVEARTSFRV